MYAITPIYSDSQYIKYVSVFLLRIVLKNVNYKKLGAIQHNLSAARLLESNMVHLIFHTFSIHQMHSMKFRTLFDGKNGETDVKSGENLHKSQIVAKEINL